MLVLSRHVNEKIVVQAPNCEPITIVVVGVSGDRVRIGVHAPPSVEIHREEVAEAIARGEGRWNDASVRADRQLAELDAELGKRIQQIDDARTVDPHLLLNVLSERFGVSVAYLVARQKTLRGES